MTFRNWPWTKTYRSGTITGFWIGSSKLACFQRGIALEQEGQIVALGLLDEKPGTYEEEFKGTDLTEADFGTVRASKIWHLALAGENAWLLLFFEDEVLARIERKDYRGPTE